MLCIGCALVFDWLLWWLWVLICCGLQICLPSCLLYAVIADSKFVECVRCVLWFITVNSVGVFDSLLIFDYCWFGLYC